MKNTYRDCDFKTLLYDLRQMVEEDYLSSFDNRECSEAVLKTSRLLDRMILDYYCERRKVR